MANEEVKEYWGDYKGYRKDKKTANSVYSKYLLKELGIQYVEKNNGVHLFVENKYNFYPTTGKILDLKMKPLGRGVETLIELIKQDKKENMQKTKLTIDDLDVDEVKKQSKVRAIYGTLMYIPVAIITSLWNIIFIGGMQLVQLALIFLLDLITLNTLHFEGSPTGIKVHLKLLKKQSDYTTIKTTFKKD